MTHDHFVYLFALLEPDLDQSIFCCANARYIRSQHGWLEASGSPMAAVFLLVDLILFFEVSPYNMLFHTLRIDETTP